MTEKALPTPSDFPVTWPSPDEEDWLWSHELSHYPDQVTPLEFSLIEQGVDAGLSMAARAYDIPITIRDRHINSYLYIAVEPAASPAPGVASLPEWSPGRVNSALANLRSSWESIWLPEVKQHLGWWDDFDPSNVTFSELQHHLSETLIRWLRVWEIHFLAIVPSMFAMSEFADLYQDLFPGSEPFAPYKLLAGFPNTTVQSSQELWALSRLVLASPSALEVFRGTATEDILTELKACIGGEEVLTDLHEYLDRHGQRADKLSLHDRYWVEDPAPVINNLRNFILQPDRDLLAEMRKIATDREEMALQMALNLKDYPQSVREQANFLLHAAQAGAFLSEEHGHWIDYKASFHVRQVLLTIGEHLEAAGMLHDQDDLFYLHLNEVEALLAHEGRLGRVDVDCRAQIAERREIAERFADVTPPLLLGTVPGGEGVGPRDPITEMFRKWEGAPPVSTQASDLIVGTAGSPGVVRGTVKVVHQLNDALKVQPGDILVADTTAPPWTPLFASVGGVVTNSGGILSHSAVVAREYGIPAVVGASMATHRLHDGQRVEVDGDKGVVRILEVGVER